MYRSIPARVAFDRDGFLLALVADGEDQPNPLAFLEVADGAEPLTRDAIAAALAELDDHDALQAVIDAAIAEGQAIGASDDPITADTLARINVLADAREVAEERQGAIATEAEEAQRQRDEALARLQPHATTPDGEGDGEDGDGDGEGDGDNADADNVQQPAGVTAAAGTPPAQRGRRVTALPRPGQVPGGQARPGGTVTVTRSAAPAYAAPRATTALTAAAGVPDLPMGTTIDTREQLGNAINSRRRALRNVSGGDGENVPVASITVEYPEERRLGNDLGTNLSRIREATNPQALVAAGDAMRAQGGHYAHTAAGGLCGPVEQLYDVPVIGSAARPIRDQALANFGADRGGVKWREHLSFADFAGATSIWTLANDAAVTGDPDTEPLTKPCLDVACPDDAEAFVEAITMCMTFSNVTSRFDPESTAANIDAAMIAHARFAENRLLAQIAALSTTVTSDNILGTTRDLLVGLDRLIAAYRNFYRLDDNIALRMVSARWLRDALRADLTRGMAGELEALAVASATINAWFAARNVNITWHLDGRAATVAGAGEVTMAKQFYSALADNAAIPGFPAQVENLLWVEGEMLHLDGGQLDLGVVRDSTLNQVNRYKQFTESFEGVAHRGVEAVRWVADTSTLGSVSGTTDVAAVLAA